MMVHRPRRFALAAAAIATIAGLAVLPSTAGAGTDDTLAAARERLADLQEQADDLAQRHADAEERLGELDADLHRTELAIARDQRVIERLQGVVRARALAAYLGAGRTTAFESFLGPDEVTDAVAAGRRREILDTVNRHDDDVLDRYTKARRDLDRRRDDLRDDREAAYETLTELGASAAELQETLDDAAATTAVLEERAAAEEAARRAAAARRAEQAAARRAATTTTAVPTETPRAEAPSGTAGRGTRAATPSTSPGPPTTGPPATAPPVTAPPTTAPPVTAPPTTAPPTTAPPTTAPPTPSASIVCPIRGFVSFADGWGDPRSGGRRHQGVDLFAARGTPNVAVVSGSTSLVSGSLSGLGLYLYGNDGNTYFYAHLAGYAGGARSVRQGDVIGYTGDSGNAVGLGTHTHFEFHPRGGAAVNPYPIVRAAC